MTLMNDFLGKTEMNSSDLQFRNTWAKRYLRRKLSLNLIDALEVKRLIIKYGLIILT